MNAGKVFEYDIKKSVPKDVFYLKLTDPAVSFDTAENKESLPAEDLSEHSVRFSMKNPFDIILYKWPDMFCLELKTKETKSISFAGSNPDIKSHQIKALTKAAKFCNAGFIFNFRASSNTYYVQIEAFNKLIENIGKKSVNENDVRPIGLLIPCRKLIVNNRYDLDVLLRAAKKQYRFT